MAVQENVFDVEGIMEFVDVRMGRPYLERYISHAMDIAAEAADKEVAKFFQFVARYYIGANNTPGTLSAQGAAQWPKLSENWTRRKGNEQFWVGQTGQLRQFFQGTNALDIFGPSQIRVRGTIRRKGDPYKLGRGPAVFRAKSSFLEDPILEIHPFSHINWNSFQFLESLSLPDSVGVKLYGNMNWTRAMLQPAIQHFIRNRIPERVRKDLLKAGYHV